MNIFKRNVIEYVSQSSLIGLYSLGRQVTKLYTAKHYMYSSSVNGLHTLYGPLKTTVVVFWEPWLTSGTLGFTFMTL